MARPNHPLIARRDDPPRLVRQNRPPLVITILLDKNLPKELSPNFRSRTHWPKTNAVAQARGDGKYATLSVVDPNSPYECFQTTTWPLVLHVVVARTGRAQPWDDDNAWAAIKPYRDGIASVLGVDDRHFQIGTLTQIRSDTGSAYLRIAVESIEESEAAA